jgi:hypothetical protein
MDTLHDRFWIRATYNFPFTFSIRMPLSSMANSIALPAPGPATIRLALIKKGIEHYGVEFTKQVIFPIAIHTNILIKPPPEIAISSQLLHIFKHSEYNGIIGLVPSIGIREIAHTFTTLEIFLNLAEEEEQIISHLLKSIGYWGQMDSITNCLEVCRLNPKLVDCAFLIDESSIFCKTNNYLRNFVTEIRDKKVTWDEVNRNHPFDRNNSFLKYDIIIWPLVITKYFENGYLLKFKHF